ncbi:IS1182 family transposase [Bacteroides fragilis]|uniref:IS1182 family transposase n=2 Tax=Bacteroides TaxID=816 RepID=UPI001FEFEEB4|nr:IS1182 family transposase [Bacteroides fragilis]
MLIDSANIQFKEYSQGMDSLFPCRLDENISSDAPVRLVNQIVDKLDISPLLSTYKGGGCPAYYPRMLLKVLFFAYLNNVYSCRKIARLLQENILYMWLSGKSTPDFRTINDFRSKRLKSCIHSLFTQIVLMLVELGYISLEKQYIDGTKMESAANRYTFVWRKSVEKYKDRLENKIQCILSQIDEGILGDNTAPGESTLPIDSHALKEKIDAINLENRNKRELRQIKKLNEEYLPKLQEYEKHLEIMGERNSYSKTDPDATFMRMKEDHMRNGQLKPGYNLQISTENQFITNYAFYHNPGDTLTLISFLLYGRMRYCRFMKEVCADAGYGSEENYEFMERFGISAYVKYNYFHMEQTKKWKCDISKQDNLYYNEPEDYFVCPMGQYMKFAYTIKAVNDNGYESEISVYRAKNCQGCPLQNKCHKGRGNREIKVNHKLRRYKQLAREKLTSSKGLEHRSKRPVEVEAVFGQIKWNKEYKRFRHKGLEKIVMDFGILAIAFNIGKMICKQKKAKKGRDGKDYKTDKGRKLSFMRGIFISCWINHKKRKKLEGTLFGHPLCFCDILKYYLIFVAAKNKIDENNLSV